MKPLEILISLFPTGTTEGERHILRRAFVQADEFSDLITPPPHSPRLLVGKKGSGKSAIIEFSMQLAKRVKVPAILLKPMDIDYSMFVNDAAVGELTRAAYKALLRAVAEKLGADTGGLITGEDKTLYEEAVAAGHKDRDPIEKLASILPRLAKPYTQIDISGLLPGHTAATHKKLESAIANNLAQSNSGFYLFVDDTDQIAAPDRPGHLNRIWAFLLAARELASKVEQLRCIISLREEVWRRLTSDRAGQRDQTDHFAGLVRYLNPSREHIERIIERRMVLAGMEVGGSYTSPWQLFFDGNNPHMPSSEARTSWPDLIIVRSRERPRDAVQLISGCAQRALDGNMDKITEETFASEMQEFSKVRARLLAQEVEFECPQMEQIVRSLAVLDYDYSSFKATAEVVRKHLASLGGSFPVTLYGRTMKMADDEDLFELWRFLYDVGLLNARVADQREKDGYRHIYPNEDPTLVSKARWNEMQAIVWEIGPAYRDHLIRIHAEKQAQFGLPPRGRRPKNK
jgi:hypothetical protein